MDGGGFELVYSNFRYREFSEPYHVLSLLAKLGFSRNWTEAFSIICNLNLGADLRSINSIFRIYPSLGLYAGLGLKVSERITLTAGMDVHAVLQVSERSVNNALDVGLLSWLGLRFGL